MDVDTENNAIFQFDIDVENSGKIMSNIDFIEYPYNKSLFI